MKVQAQQNCTILVLNLRECGQTCSIKILKCVCLGVRAKLEDLFSLSLVQFLRSLTTFSMCLVFKVMGFHVTWPLNASQLLDFIFT